MDSSFRIFCKDLYRFRWAGALILLFAMIRILVNGTSLGWGSLGFVGLWAYLSEYLPLLVGSVIVVLAVQEETFSDADAWWRTRPIARLQVLGAKTMFCVAVMMTTSGFPNAIILFLNHGAHRLPWHLLSLLVELPWYWFLMFLAIQTSSLARFFLHLFGVILGLSILLSGLSFLPSDWLLPLFWSSRLLPSWMDEPWKVDLVRACVLALPGYGVLFFYFQTRLTMQSWVILSVLCFGSMVFALQDVISSHFGSQSSIPLTTGDTEPVVPEPVLFAMASPSDTEEMIFYGRFYDLRIPANGDVWVYNIQAFLHGQNLRFDPSVKMHSLLAPVSTDSNGHSSFACELFRAKISELRKMESSDVIISVYFYLLFGEFYSKPLMLPCNPGATVAYHGNRIGIEKIERKTMEDGESRVMITISEIIHDLSIEKDYALPQVFSLRNEHVVFNLLNPITGATYLVDPARYWSSRVDLDARLPLSESLNDLELWMIPGSIPEEFSKRVIAQVNLRQLAGIDPGVDD
jgi:hypothetical protein